VCGTNNCDSVFAATHDCCEATALPTTVSMPPTSNPSADSTNDPTSSPSLHPNQSPTLQPLPSDDDSTIELDPTTAPTFIPNDDSTITTIDPTADPTTFPTESPTTSTCSIISVDLINFHKFTANELDDSIAYQSLIGNATRFAIADVSADSGIGSNAFNVIYANVTASEEFANGTLKRALHIDQYLCVFDGSNVNALSLIVQNQHDEIAEALHRRLMAVFYGGNDDGALIVLVYDEMEIEPATIDTAQSPTFEPTRDPTYAVDRCTMIVVEVNGGFTISELNDPEVQNDIADSMQMAIIEVDGIIDEEAFTVFFENAESDYDEILQSTVIALNMSMCTASSGVYAALLGVFENQGDEIEGVLATKWSEQKGVPSEDMMVSAYLPIQITTEPPVESVSWWEPYMTPFGVLVLLVMVSWFLLAVLGYAHMKYRNHDDVNFMAVFMFGLYAWDVFSDIFFASDVWALYQSPDHSLYLYENWSHRDANWILFGLFAASSFFIVFPMVMSFVALFIAQKDWRKDTEISETYSTRIDEWLGSNSAKLSFLSFISGSSFAAVELVNSRVFGLDLFCMNLAKKHLDAFNQHRLWSVVFSENLPQLILQCAFTWMVLGEIGSVTGMAMVSSALSIFAAVTEWNTKKLSKEMRDKWPTDFASVTIKVEKDDAEKMQNQGYMHRTKVLKKTLEAKMGANSPCKVEILHVKHNTVRSDTNIHMFITFQNAELTAEAKSNGLQEIESNLKDTIDDTWMINIASDRESNWDLKMEWNSKKSTGDIELPEFEGTITAGGDVNAAEDNEGATTAGGGIPAASMIPSQRTMSYHRSNSFSEEDNESIYNETGIQSRGDHWD